MTIALTTWETPRGVFHITEHPGPFVAYQPVSEIIALDNQIFPSAMAIADEEWHFVLNEASVYTVLVRDARQHLVGYLVAVSAGAVDMFLTEQDPDFFLYNHECLYLYSLGVAPDLQGGGFFTPLLTSLEQYAQATARYSSVGAHWTDARLRRHAMARGWETKRTIDDWLGRKAWYMTYTF